MTAADGIARLIRPGAYGLSGNITMLADVMDRGVSIPGGSGSIAGAGLISKFSRSWLSVQMGRVETPFVPSGVSETWLLSMDLVL